MKLIQSGQKKIFLGIWVILSIFLLYSNAFATSYPPIKFGFILDYSGPASKDMKRFEDGVRLYMEEVGWKIQNRVVEFISEDHAGDPAKGTEKAQKLVMQDKVDVVIGPIMGHVAFASAPVIAETGTVHMFPVGQSVELLKSGNGNVFMIRGTHFGENYLSGVYAYEDLGYRSTILLHDDFIAGEELTGGAIRAFADRGGEIVQTLKVPYLNFDYAPYINSMKKADFVSFWVIYPAVSSFLRQYDQFKKEMPLIYTFFEGFHETLAPAGDILNDIIGQRAWSPDLETEINKKFKADCIKKLGRNATHFEAAGYAIGIVLAEAINMSNGDTDSQKLAAAIRKLKVNTPEGMISFSERGIGIGDEMIVKLVKNKGRYETKVLKTYPQIERKAPWE